jgi:biotin carboxyl carrier protein
MKLQAEIADDKHAIELRREDGKVFATVDGRIYELDCTEPEPGVFLFNHGGTVYEAYVSQPSGPTDAIHIRVGPNEFDIRILDPKRLRSSGLGTDHGDGLAEIKTAMPGKVVRILVGAGDDIEKGDGVVVVEAMKMQNELRSPKSGRVKDIRVGEGATVAAGDILATIE